MSTLAAVQADGFYYPPDEDPAHPRRGRAPHDRRGALGARAKHADKGVLIVRVEMPYNAQCTACHWHIGRGVRFNATKYADGKYHSTQIWAFRMACPKCSADLIMRTNPQKECYDAGGALRWTSTVHTVRDIEHINYRTSLALTNDPLFAAEHAAAGERRAAAAVNELIALRASADARGADDIASNAAARAVARAGRKDRASAQAWANSKGLGIAPADAESRSDAQDIAVHYRRQAVAAQASKMERAQAKVEDFAAALQTCRRVAVADDPLRSPAPTGTFDQYGSDTSSDSESQR